MALQPVIDAAWVRALPRERIANAAARVRPLPGGKFPRSFSFTAAMRKMTGASYRRIVEQTESFAHEYLRPAQEGVVSVLEGIVRVEEDTFDKRIPCGNLTRTEQIGYAGSSPAYQCRCTLNTGRRCSS